MPNDTEDFSDCQGSAAVKNDVASVSLPARLPPFWRQNPRLWFAQFEAAVAASKISEEQKFNLVVPLLGNSDLEQIGDIILHPPTTGKYSALKDRLISTYQESDHRQLQKLLSGLELGDNKPSQLLRKMRDLSGKLLSDEALKVMWLNQLPTQVRAVLSVNTESSLEVLAAMADKMMEHFEPATVAAVSSANPPSTSPAVNESQINAITALQISMLTKQIEKLSLEVAELRNHQYSSHRRSRQNSAPRGRSRSHSRHRTDNARKPGDPDWLCRYHYRFGNGARKCESPCSFTKREN
ncbi:hypothetical protein PYW07_002955 [Mythimna separata]|uniref:DUF7041 domain-containing protein n=1 Tax=Mythimna separata TaxID=271217 RepID=A0AAD8DQX8_MYTSE|nr:hypothetical protein PYW07_002955 [Mythimna separata]